MPEQILADELGDLTIDGVHWRLLLQDARERDLYEPAIHGKSNYDQAWARVKATLKARQTGTGTSDDGWEQF